jgi:threonine/homoserine/homoserine lactone efflux protein
MSLSFLAHGAVIGFCIAAPVGPIGVLCIRRSLQHGFRAGFYTGLGAATADAFYGAVAAFGLTAISSFLTEFQVGLAVVGGLLLCYLGVRGILAEPPRNGGGTQLSPYLTAYFSTLFLTLTNPATILSFVVIFAGAGLTRATNLFHAAAMVIGVFAGSAVWWLFLSGAVSAAGQKINRQFLRATNSIAGGLMVAFGLYILLRAITRGGN